MDFELSDPYNSFSNIVQQWISKLLDIDQRRMHTLVTDIIVYALIPGKKTSNYSIYAGYEKKTYLIISYTYLSHL